ncbi:MAG: electron transfer flavoprotein subunit alpha/FixB family protein, partial [Deltaproteobacteria bacterium]|nr:electron transfer flavoprotein subunit alpha/FixB family protein [Deltaproteobacteria bacterium]
MNDVLILGEVREGSLYMKTLELIGAGKKLAGDLDMGLSIVLMGDELSKVVDQIISYGPDKVYKLEHPLLKGFKADLWVESLEQLCRQINPKIILMGHSFIGMELGPRLACRLNTRLTMDCIDLSIDPEDGVLLRTKPVSGGNAISVFKCPGEPQLVTLRGKVFTPAEPADGNGEIVDMVPEIDESMIRVESVEIVKEEIVALDKANVVVSGGAGLGEEDGFEILNELAKALGKSFGSVMVGCSRVAVDKRWISSDHQVGLTGTIISPDIYVAVGISGAIQHLVGMVNSKKIIAINNDPGCNMFKVADYGVVEDYEEIIPALIEKLE